jgi:hypothetical protein
MSIQNKRSYQEQLRLLYLIRNGCPKGSFLWKKNDSKLQEFIKQHNLEAAE